MDSTFSYTGFALAGDWARYRSTITELYLEENKPLKEVKQIMEEQYFFFATDKMYKNHFKRWRVQKNFRHHQVSELLAEKSKRVRPGESTKLYIHGREVDEDRLNTYLRRVTPSRRRLIEANTTILLRQETRLPHMRSIPRRLKAPDTLEATESCFHFVSVYADSSCTSEPWQMFFASKKMNEMKIRNSFWNTLNSGILSSNAGRITHGFKLISHSFYLFKKLLISRYPFLIINMCSIFRYLSQVLNGDLLDLFISYACKMSQIILPPGHPICSILSTIRKAGLAGLYSWQNAMVQYYIQVTQILDRSSLELFVSLCIELLSAGFVNSEISADHILGIFSEILHDGRQEDSELEPGLWLQVAYISYSQRKDDETKNLIERYVESGLLDVDTKFAYILQQRIFQLEGNNDGMMEIINEQLRLLSEYDGTVPSYAIYAYLWIENDLRDMGFKAKADEILEKVTRGTDILCEELDALELEEYRQLEGSRAVCNDQLGSH
ncbi:Clr5 domain-containing protein [Camillea tinctor]|nr:Clr5 domain-containing protein [Camillea tinctor]